MDITKNKGEMGEIGNTLPGRGAPVSGNDDLVKSKKPENEDS